MFLSWTLVSLTLVLCVRHFRMTYPSWYRVHAGCAVYLLALTIIMPSVALWNLDPYYRLHQVFGIITMVVCALQVGGGFTLFFLKRASLLSLPLLKIFRMVHTVSVPIDQHVD